MARTPLSTTHPTLASELVDSSLADTISFGSTKKVEWECSSGHRWFARPNSRSHGAGCPVCAGKTIIPGVNDLATVDPILAQECTDSADAQKITAKSSKKISWTCTQGHTWSASPNTRSNGHGCPACAGKAVITGVNDLATLHPECAALLVDKDQAQTLMPFSQKVCEWVCEHGHQWQAPVARIVSGARCPYCSGFYAIPGVNDLATTHPELAAQCVNPDDARTHKTFSNKKIEWECSEGHRWFAAVGSRVQGRGCPMCARKTVVPGINDVLTTHPHLISTDPDHVSTLSYGSKQSVEWVCSRGHTWSARPNDRTAKNSGCPACAAQKYVSQAEHDTVDFLRSLNPSMMIRTTVRNLIDGELDIVLPDKGIAIEVNGTFFHHDGWKKPRYHRDKTQRAQAAGYQLFHIWSDDWKDRKNIVIRTLAHHLGYTHRLSELYPELGTGVFERIGARECTPVVLKASTAQEFLTAHHIQGSVSATYHFGLEDSHGVLRAIMSVRSARNNARLHRTPGQWDIQRYATHGIIPGGFTKLLKFAQNYCQSQGHECSQWVSLSDDAISDGSLYRSAGFEFSHTNPPNYWYVGDLTKWRRVPKENFQKKRFRDDPNLVFDESWSERQAAQANGLYRIYDAGKHVWIKNI